MSKGVEVKIGILLQAV